MHLHIQNLSKSYGKQNVLKDASFSFEQGKIYSILGRNGAGKTTLFNCINGDLKYESGRILYSDGTTERPLTFSDVGMVSTSPVLPEYLTGYEFIHFFIKLHGRVERSAEEWLDLVRIEPKDYFRLIKSYSFGMKNKLQLLCCLIRNPKIILLDEPLSSFDIIVSHDIKELMIAMKSDHIILMSTHILQLAKDVSDDIVLLHQGRLSAMDPEDLSDDKFEASIIAALKEGA
ncbi:MAG TPA: ABC transporter ATP-binding protein [Clostridiaceae bacterium]|jgi:ABC-2 type transport system ATP-binding protein|nr:ABC transporter ATP-binding protein [Clostridiaceae bacterium]